MKKIKILVVFSLLYTCHSSFSQTSKFKCNASQYADEHTDNKRWNDLIDNACIEINKGKYEDGYKMLSDAMTLDSLTSTNGVIHEYIGLQLRNLRKYIDSDKGESNASGNSDADQTSKSTSEVEKSESKKIADENSKTEAGNQVQTETAVAPETEPEKVESPEVSDPPKPIVPESKSPDPVPEPVKEDPESYKSTDNGEKTFSELEMKDFEDKGMQ
ncbi:MAG: hypothetical protein ABI855_19745, partial [Bacteroidota bacterium]